MAATARQAVACVGPEAIAALASEAQASLAWLRAGAPELFSGVIGRDAAAVTALAAGLSRLGPERRLVLADREDELVVARLDVPGATPEAIPAVRGRELSCAELLRSSRELPRAGRRLELQRYELVPAAGPRPAGEAPPAGAARRRAVRAALAAAGAELRASELDELLRVLWRASPRVAELSPAADVAELVRALREGRRRGGLVLEVPAEGGAPGEAKLLLAVESPPRRHLEQLLEVLGHLDVEVHRGLLLVADAGRPLLVGALRVGRRGGGPIEPGAEPFAALRRQLHAAQLVAAESPSYSELVLGGLLTAEEAALVDALVGFCHTSCAHAQPHRYGFEDVVRAFQAHPGVAVRLVRLFQLRFDPELPDRDGYARELAEVERGITAHHTGHPQLDEFRRSVFRAALAFVRRTLKTNFFVPEKRALAFRLDPAYLEDLGPEFTRDLPPARPFRVTFFSGRSGLGYHVAYADIARGGWRTVVARSRDDFVTVANGLFRECAVLAYTQHLKNKDIYEGGSKLVCVLRAPDADSRERLAGELRGLQLAFAGAFLDLFVTRGGRAADPRVVDYLGADEPIELGPDENMHDGTIEEIADLAAARGYVLGRGIVSSKRAGINHKQYGVTSLGVVTFVEAALRERGLDPRRDAFTVKMTGGPNGDVAGNALRLLLERCPGVRVRLVLDGTAALFDPRGLDRDALSGLVLRADANAFPPGALSPGGFVLDRSAARRDGLRQLHRRVEMTAAGPRETWVGAGELHEELERLPFTVGADLFLPAGGRPETIHAGNWRRFLGEDGAPSAPLVVEGANSFLSPDARDALQRAGAVVLRDAAANKCGVISSSYEIIANLLLSEDELLACKAEYVRDVLAILERRASDEAQLILRRHRAPGGRSYTDISDGIAVEINAHKARLFSLFEARPELLRRPAYRRALLAHLPAVIQETPRFRRRIERLPPKHRAAMVAAELAARLVYGGGLEPDFERAVEEWAAREFA